MRVDTSNSIGSVWSALERVRATRQPMPKQTMERRCCQGPGCNRFALGGSRHDQGRCRSSEPIAGLVHVFQLCLGKRQVQGGSLEVVKSGDWKGSSEPTVRYDSLSSIVPRLRNAGEFEPKTCSAWR